MKCVLVILRKSNATTVYLMKENKKINILGCIIISIKKVTCVKCVGFFKESMELFLKIILVKN